LPKISLGLWHNFGGIDDFALAREMVLRSFDLGITHFDLANNYGPPPGSAESTFGKILKNDLHNYRDELIITSKAGYGMWDGPYGEWGSRKYLIASCDQSLRRLGVDYVDVFYSHRPDPETPISETMMALDQLVRSGKALYVGISSYSPKQSKEAFEILNELGTPCLIHQPSYNMFDRWIEDGLLDVLEEYGVGAAVFSPLAQGLLTDKYLKEIPADSRISKEHGFLQRSALTPERLAVINQLNELATSRGQKLSQMALAWALRDERITSVIVGASKIGQIEDAVNALTTLEFTTEELSEIESILTN
jgi:L-glyceraldehyde 3-phosphate reductase